MIQFTIDGEPASKERARVTPRGTYTPAKTVAAEQKIAWLFRAAARGWKVDKDSHFTVTCVFTCGTKRRRDIDNMLKLILDGLNGVCWADDNQVTEIAAIKEYGTPAGTFVTIYRIGE